MKRLAACLLLFVAGCDCGTSTPDSGVGGGSATGGGTTSTGGGGGGSMSVGGGGANNDAGIDAGEDAGAADGGVDGGEDAGAPDSGFDGGTDSGIDAGSDAGSPELCDGIDNDNDGTVDRLSDGGPLTAACTLTLGVCAGKLSLCIDGGWATCDYGPDYQLTERNCDGLDNDCDGRIDRSSKHVLFGVDAGLGIAGGLDSTRTQLIVRDGGFRIVLANEVLDLSVELEPVDLQRPVPVHYNDSAILFADGVDWLRLQTYNEAPTSACLTADRFTEDGGTDLADGGADVIADVCWPGLLTNQTRALPTPGGWMMAFVPIELGADVLWATLQTDGGFDDGSFDAGLFSNVGQLILADDQTDQFLLWQYGADPLQVYSFVPPAPPQLSFSLPNPTGYCFATANPVGYACGSIASQTWFLSDGGQLAPAFDGLVLGDNHGTPPLAGISFDGGDPSVSFTLSELVDGGIVPYADFDNQPLVWDFKVTNLGDRLQLVLWGEHLLSGMCPNCTIEAYSAEYVCAP